MTAQARDPINVCHLAKYKAYMKPIYCYRQYCVVHVLTSDPHLVRNVERIVVRRQANVRLLRAIGTAKA